MFLNASPARACAPGTADCFLQNIGEDAIKLLGDAQIAESDREARFLKLLQQDFNVPRISRFIVGRYWRGASEAERNDFMEVFGKVMARRFVPLFSDISSDQFKVGEARQDSQDAQTYFVETIITAGNKKPVKASWRIEAQDDGTFKILDVVVEGVSYAMTLRSEYASVLKRDNGDVGKLVTLLRQMVN